jgi:nicotinamidase-related amidase
VPVDLRALVDPAHTALVTCEMQRGIIGDHAELRDLADEVEAAAMVPRCVELLDAARAKGMLVVHALIVFRHDLKGTAVNNPLLGRMTKNPTMIREGTPQAELLPELGPLEGDLVSIRHHGMSPFGGTSLDAWLRNSGIRTIVPVGVSVNEAIFGLCLEAANLGYRIALPTDAVAGYPRSYALDVLRHSISLMANLTTTADVLDAWR